MEKAPPRAVLVVDDDDDIRMLLEELLRGAGYGVKTAQDGRAALRAFHDAITSTGSIPTSLAERAIAN